ncbi:esterase CG5412 [Calliphora vicina]|uniref:esterase CG5412 n=1 Tax=Calliphora vicina TaxID=7373 RepID=UPI00325B7C6F
MTNNEAASSSAPTSSSKKKSSTSQLEIKDKVRVLCLHGYRQNADSFKSKLGSFRKHVNKYAEFVFIDAPHKAKPMEEGVEPQPDQLSWWFNKDDGSFKGTNRNGPAFGFQESLKLVEDTWKTQGPFQGLLGFSQGACFVGLLCGLARKKLTSIRPEFAILSSGFLSGSLVHKSAYEESIIIPTLHVYGLSDEIIPKEMSQELANHFKNVEVLEHNGGHYFPATSQQKQTYINFFQDRLQEYLENLELQQTSNAAFVEEQQGEEVEGEIQTISDDSEDSA